MRNKIIPYSPHLKEYARQLRNNSTLSEVLLWKNIKSKGYGFQFHRQVPLLNYIVDFYCHELMLAIEIDGESHQFKYEYDARRQGELEKEGVTFLRFTDIDIKQNMFSVLLTLEQKLKNYQT
ncbi:endonuclease domain-containing protein [Flavobacterium sp. AS60]|uniref:endonuclease domain-containing protein n=1 Tax=Flavobacterium anseongense TaxID=2910677 RepID=UPI001F4216F5|nr:endonuclease domain-containing protein [Flavobacterium sp. AS60]MCF6130341.1 endonuclease domain-containing protein [Flavobacterium sp. AS60]